MEEVYTPTRGFATANPDERSGPRSFLRQIEAVKEGSRIEEVAADYGEFRLAGDGRLVGRCLSPEHEDRTPSMYVYADDPHFHCFGCGESGDVVDLVRLVEGCEFWEAMMILKERYGISLPERPRSWFERQERQAPVRDTLDAQRIEHIRLLLFRFLWTPWLKRLPEWAREEAADSAWAGTLPLARQLYAQRREA